MKITAVDFSSMPVQFGRCIVAGCPVAEGCLRRLAMLRGDPQAAWLNIVNPAVVPANAPCEHYIDASRPAYARGLILELDNVPHAAVRAFRRELERLYTRPMQLRLRRGEKILSPSEQQALTQLCEKHGVPAPKYREFVHPWGLD